MPKTTARENAPYMTTHGWHDPADCAGGADCPYHCPPRTPTEARDLNLALAASDLYRAGECERIGFVRGVLLEHSAEHLRAVGEDALAERAMEAARSTSADAGIAALHADVLDLIRARLQQHLLCTAQRQLAQIEAAKAEFRALVDAWVTKYPPDDEERDFLGDFLADYFHERETASRAAMERAS